MSTYTYLPSTVEPTNYLTLVTDVEVSVVKYAQDYLHETSDAAVTFSIFTLLNCGCYECITGLSAGPVNEGGQGECIAGNECVEIFINNKPAHLVTVSNYLYYVKNI